MKKNTLGRNETISKLYSLLPAQLDVIVTELGIPAELLSGLQAPLVMRANEVLRWVEQQNRGTDLEELLLKQVSKTPLSYKSEVLIHTNRLPHTGPDLIGREEELDWLDKCWEQRAHAASIVAWGGVGKSCLVNAWIQRIGKDDWRGAERVYAWSFYSQGTTNRPTSADDFISSMLTWFGDQDPSAGTAWDKGERLAGYIRKERTLLILDELESLQWSPGENEGKIKDPALQTLVRELAAHNNGLCLVTSRLNVADIEDRTEARQRLSLKHLSPEASVELLSRKGVKGTGAQLLDAAVEYKGHCLALALLASYLEEACDGDVRRRKEIGPLEDDERQGEHAKRIMRAYERLFEHRPELAILRMLGYFDRPATAGEVNSLRNIIAVEEKKQWYHFFTGTPRRAISNDEWASALARLRRVGLLTPTEPNEDRLDAHPLVREHFGEQLKKEDPDAWREGHRRLYEYLEKSAKPLPDTIEEMQPLYAAAFHGCMAGKNEEVFNKIYRARIQRSGEHFNVRKLGAFGSHVELLSAFFDPPWEWLSPGLTESDQAVVLSDAGFSLRALGRLAEACTLMSMSLEKRIAQEAWSQAAIVAHNISELFTIMGKLDDALAHAEEGVVFARRGEDFSMLMANRMRLADVLHQTGDLANAREQFEKAKKMAAKRRPELYIISSFGHSDFLIDQGEGQRATERAVLMLRLASRDGLLLETALAHISLGRATLQVALRKQGDFDSAREHFCQAVAGLRSAGTQHELPRGLLARAAFYTTIGACDKALRDLDEVLFIASQCGMRLHEADCNIGYARLYLTANNVDQVRARTCLEKAKNLIEVTGYHRRDAAIEELGVLLSQALDYGGRGSVTGNQ